MQGSTPRHVAIIMDGNGRWAERRGRPRIFGHIRGCGRVRDIIREASDTSVEVLTLYAFSTENWGRPAQEVDVLMRLLYKWLIRERRELMEKNIRFQAIGAVDRLPPTVQKIVRQTEEMSSANTGMKLMMALSYSSRQELVQAARGLAEKVARGELAPENITEEVFAENLLTASVGDPDLLIRTSGEQRVSNFLLWQLAYTELYFTDTMWPDFKVADFRRALDSFARRQRRFGLTSPQSEAHPI